MYSFHDYMQNGGMMFREAAGGDISIPNLSKLQVGGYFPRFMKDGGLPKYQVEGWVQRAADNGGRCDRFGRPYMGGGSGSGREGRESAPISGFDSLSDLSSDAWFDSDRLKEIKRSRPEGVDKQMWNAINAEARRLNNSYTNKYVWGENADPNTGRLDPKYLLPENKDKVNIPSYYPYYENTPLRNNKSINPQDIYQYYSGQPGGLESFKTLINNNYMPQKKTGGEMIRRANGSYSQRGLWDNIRANKGSGKKPTKQMLEQERKIKSKEMKNGGTNNEGFKALPPYVQNKILSRMNDGGYTGTFSGNAYYQQGGMPQQPKQGGGEEEQIMQLIQAYAQISQVDPQQIMQQLQQMQPEEQQQAIQQMAQTVQQASSGAGQEQQQEQMQEQPQMQNGGMPCYNCGGMYQYGGQMGGSYMPSMPAVSIYDLPIYQEEGEVVTPRWHPEWNDQQYSDEALSGQYDQEAADNAAVAQANEQALAQYPAPQMPQFTQQASPYQGNSIVDYLKSIDFDSSPEARKKLAQEKGILNYQRKDYQNLQLLDILRGGKTTIPTGNVSAKSAAKRAETNSANNEAEESEITAPYNFDDGNILRKGWTPTLELQKGTFQKGLPNKNNKDGVNNSALLWGTVGLSTLLAGAALTNRELQEVKSKFINNDFTKDFSPTVKRKITLAKNKLINESITKGGKEAKAVADLFKKMPKMMQNILGNLDAMEISGDIYQTRQGTAGRNLEAWNALNESRAEESIMNQQELMRMQQEAAEEAKAIRSAAARRGASPAQVAAEESKFMNALKSGYGAMREAPAMRKAAQLFKYFRKEDGGGIDDGINEMQKGGWNIGDYHVPDGLKTAVQILDPTGVSSYGDAYDSYQDLYNNPSWGNAGSALLETVSALPIVGKVGKAAKATTKLGKAYRAAEKVLSPVSKMDRMNPIGAGVGAFNRTMLQGAPRVVRGAAQVGSDFNQGRRFFTAADAGIDGLDNMMGYLPQQAYGGYMDPAWMAEGGIHINPANRGKFTASAQRAGMGVQEFAGKVLANKEDYSSTQVKRANFARNASKWKHQEGGSIGVGSYVDDTPEMRAWLDSNGYTYE